MSSGAIGQWTLQTCLQKKSALRPLLLLFSSIDAADAVVIVAFLPTVMVINALTPKSLCPVSSISHLMTGSVCSIALRLMWENCGWSGAYAS